MTNGISLPSAGQNPGEVQVLNPHDNDVRVAFATGRATVSALGKGRSHGRSGTATVARRVRGSATPVRGGDGAPGADVRGGAANTDKRQGDRGSHGSAAVHRATHRSVAVEPHRPHVNHSFDKTVTTRYSVVTTEKKRAPRVQPTPLEALTHSLDTTRRG